MDKMDSYISPEIAGSDLVHYSNNLDKVFSYEDLRKFLSGFQLNKALSLVGEISYDLFMHPQPFRLINEKPVAEYMLAYIALQLIKSSKDKRNKLMTGSDLSIACEMCLNLEDPIYQDHKFDEFNIRLGNSQLDFDRDKKNSLSRALAIYKKLWHKFDPNQLDIDESIKKITRLSLEESLFLSYFFAFSSGKGYFCQKRFPETVRSSQDKSKIINSLKPSNQKSFIDWVSCDYALFRKDEELSLNPSCDQYRFNPLKKYPVVTPDRNLIQTGTKTYIVPVPRLLYERVSRGIYFDLANYYQGEGSDNLFKTSFGHVFQEYVGNLLRETINYAEVIKEWVYAKPNDKTPDWIICAEGKAILVEVKQSGLYLRSKSSGNIEDVKNDIKKTVASAVKQLWTFEDNIHNGKYENLEPIRDCEIVERLVVIYDSSYFFNSILRSATLEIFPNIPRNYSWHVVSVEELEQILGLTDLSLFEILKEKRLDSRGYLMDFKNYVARKYRGKAVRNKYLDSILDTYLTNEMGRSLPELRY